MHTLIIVIFTLVGFVVGFYLAIKLDEHNEKRANQRNKPDSDSVARSMSGVESLTEEEDLRYQEHVKRRQDLGFLDGCEWDDEKKYFKLKQS